MHRVVAEVPVGHQTAASSPSTITRPTLKRRSAFGVRDRATVDEFHRVATSAGYADNGEPGERPQYHPGYYGAFVLDPDGHNVEAVFHDR
jgi:predicted lactoylglutathione lyase